MLEIRNVHKTFNLGTINEKHALNGVDLKLDEGDFVTVIGGNGAGKSTMLNAVAGTWPVDEGSILIDGVDVTGLPEFKRATFLGRVFQDPMTGTTATMQIDENLALAARRGQKRGLRWGITKAEKEQGGRIKDLSVEITFDTGKAKNWKNLHLEMDGQAVNLLVKKNVKELKVNGGNVNLTFDSKALKELKKEMNTAVVIKMKQADKKNLSARAGKIIGKRPVYDFSVTGIKKKQSSVLKKGRIRVAVSYNASKKEKDKKIFAYKIDKYGAAVKIPGSYYDSDTKTVNFVSRGFFTVAVGCEK